MAQKPKTGSKPPQDGIDKTVNDDVRAVLQNLNKEFKKKYEIGSPDFGDEVDLSVELYSTGILSLDEALSGGLPQGRITEFFGEQQSGKSLIAQICVADRQRQGKTCVWFDIEQSFSAEWATQLGVDVPALVYSSNVMAEEVFDMISSYASTGKVDLIVVDSLAALMSQQELEAEMGARQYSPLAGVLSRVLKKVNPILSKTGTSLLLINQVREDMGAMVPTWTTPGGQALKHFCSTRVHVKKPPASKQLKQDKDVLGLDISVKVAKHRGGPNFREAQFRLWYEFGVDKLFDLVQVMLKMGGLFSQGLPTHLKTRSSLVNRLYLTNLKIM